MKQFFKTSFGLSAVFGIYIFSNIVVRRFVPVNTKVLSKILISIGMGTVSAMVAEKAVAKVDEDIEWYAEMWNKMKAKMNEKNVLQKGKA
jgi:prefoldin subunit 5